MDTMAFLWCNNERERDVLALWIKFQEISHLIKHPLEANCSGALILGSTTEPVQIVNFIQGIQYFRNITPPLFNRENFPIRAYIDVTV